MSVETGKIQSNTNQDGFFTRVNNGIKNTKEVVRNGNELLGESSNCIDKGNKNIEKTIQVVENGDELATKVDECANKTYDNLKKMFVKLIKDAKTIVKPIIDTGKTIINKCEEEKTDKTPDIKISKSVNNYVLNSFFNSTTDKKTKEMYLQFTNNILKNHFLDKYKKNFLRTKPKIAADLIINSLKIICVSGDIFKKQGYETCLSDDYFINTVEIAAENLFNEWEVSSIVNDKDYIESIKYFKENIDKFNNSNDVSTLSVKKFKEISTTLKNSKNNKMSSDLEELAETVDLKFKSDDLTIKKLKEENLDLEEKNLDLIIQNHTLQKEKDILNEKELENSKTEKETIQTKVDIESQELEELKEERDNSQVSAYKNIHDTEINKFFFECSKIQISDEGLKKNLMGGLISGFLGGAGGAVTGAVLGSWGGPIGIVAGGVFGAFFGGAGGVGIGLGSAQVAIYFEDYQKWKKIQIKQGIYKLFMEFISNNKILKKYICPINNEIVRYPINIRENYYDGYYYKNKKYQKQIFEREGINIDFKSKSIDLKAYREIIEQLNILNNQHSNIVSTKMTDEDKKATILNGLMMVKDQLENVRKEVVNIEKNIYEQKVKSKELTKEQLEKHMKDFEDFINGKK
jgi:hypothetical protein